MPLEMQNEEALEIRCSLKQDGRIISKDTVKGCSNMPEGAELTVGKQ
jgi:hypothetical protein